ncbi:MAG: 2-C-methyl-D-erythritol 2,4-cyclodiphosphate synthase [Elusimicrobia bacterium]|nr:2-C-methyl-D-erythritol 2,4-cyclodiphosphate synthase [Elusimicrobiota bacterium]
MRIGLGFDLHRIKTAARGYLLLGGIKIPAPYKVAAHSDGDLLFHALADALASALGLGDIGEFFPPGSSATRAMNSRRILDFYLGRMKKSRKKLLSVSAVIVAERPKLGPYRERLRRALAQSLGLPLDAAGLTFKTFEAMPALAEGSIACWANCLLK